MESFDHERLEVYQAALQFVVLAEEIIQSLPPGHADRCDQIRRASTSAVLNIAEGAGEFSKKEKARFYRIAKRSATECAGVLDIFRVLKLVEQDRVVAARALLIRIVAMLTRMVLNFTSSGSGSGKGSGSGSGLSKPKG